MMLNCVFPVADTTDVGAPGTVRGVPDAAGLLAAPVPATLVAVTVTVYAVPLLSPVMVHEGVIGVPVLDVQLAPVLVVAV